MIGNKYFPIVLFFVTLYVSISSSVRASEPDTHLKHRESSRKLMEMLSPEPVVNTGIDGVLTQLSKESPRSIDEGRGVYSSHCAACHGNDLQGQADWEQADANGMLPAPPHDDSGHTWHHADDQLFEMVKYGAPAAMGDPSYRSMMPAFKDILSDEEINAVLVFIRSTWSEGHKKWQQSANDAQTGKDWWRQKKQ